MGWKQIKIWCKENSVSIWIIVGAMLGLMCGFIIRSIWKINSVVLSFIGLPGKLIIRAFMMILVPLVVSSLSTSVAATKPGENKKMIILTFSLFIIFSSFTSLFGSTLICIVKPGGIDVIEDINKTSTFDNRFSVNQMITSQEDALYDVFINMIPDNIITATFIQQYTSLVPVDPNNKTSGYRKVQQNSFRTNMLGLCIFSLILGFAIMSLQEKAATIKTLLQETNLIVMRIMMFLLKIMPFGMFFWMCVEAIQMKSADTLLSQLIWFFGVALSAFFIHLFLVLPGIYFIIVRKNPYKFYFGILNAIFVAFGSSSSALTLPMTMKCMEENNKLDESISKFVLPLGMTANMNGSAMYYPMVTLFVAQMKGAPVGVQMIVTLCVFAVLMSMAMPGSPSGGSSIVNFIAFCAFVGIQNPLDILAYIMTVDWLIERIRTVINVVGDCFIAAIIEKICVKPNHQKEDTH